ncbi:MAG TPA: UDP-N-acetylmuramate dehydrogenase [Longimicrobiales bacterium]
MNERLDRLKQLLEERIGVGRVVRDERLAPYTTFRVGGPADLLVHARSAGELIDAIGSARELGVPFFLLGMGANILVGDGGFRGLVVHCDVGPIEDLGDARIRAGAGVAVFPDLINYTVARGLGGLHHFVGIPSTVGGAIWQNLHFLSPAPARERTVFIAEVVESCVLLGESGAVREVGVDELRFGYDYSILHDRPETLLSATFRLAPTPEAELRRVMRENLEWRDEKHPDLWLYPCAGSIFQKIEGVGAGRLIDQCGLKGYVHPRGTCGIFHRHANIIVNYGGATARDILDLIELAQSTVKEKLGYELTPEIGLIGELGSRDA